MDNFTNLVSDHLLLWAILLAAIFAVILIVMRLLSRRKQITMIFGLALALVAMAVLMPILSMLDENITLGIIIAVWLIVLIVLICSLLYICLYNTKADATANPEDINSGSGSSNDHNDERITVTAETNENDRLQELQFLKKTADIYVEKYGLQHEDTAVSFYNLALAYYRMGDYRQAREYYLKAARIREQCLGAEHTDTLQAYQLAEKCLEKINL